MPKKYQETISVETEAEAMKIARANQRPNQTKEQTKLIAQGIEKGIAQYKKQQKVTARGLDKHRKQEIRQKQIMDAGVIVVEKKGSSALLLPWLLLGLTWAGIIVYALIQKSS